MKNKPNLGAALVGRGPEMRELDEAFGRALATSQAQVVTIIGTPGIGKTRLVDEFAARIRGRERRVLVGRSQCREGMPALGIVQRLLRARFGLLEGQPVAQASARFQEAVEETLGVPASADFLHFLGSYLGLPFVESEFTKAVQDDPQGFATLSRSVLRRWFEADAAKRPFVLLIEDLHAADDAFLDLIEYLASALQGVPVLIVVSTRPELVARRSTWLSSAGDRHSRIDLAPLSGDDAASLLYRLLEPLAEGPLGEVPAELVDSAVHAAGGTPYLLEQFIHAYVDAGVLSIDEEGVWTADTERLPNATLPLTVEDAISARISALSPAERELLEKAATMGGVFWLGGLVTLSRVGSPAPELWGGHESLVTYYEQMLADLARRDYVLSLPDSSLPGEVEFAFKHNLERETLNKLTHRVEVKRLHRVVAEWLEFRVPERGEEQLAMLGHHYEKGGQASQAAACFLEAGDLARTRHANEKAAEFLGRGLELLDEANDVRGRMHALHAYGDVLQLAGRNDDALIQFRQMLELAYRLDLKAKGGVAHNRIGRVFRSTGRLDEAMRHLGTGQALFDSSGDERGVASSIDDIGKVHWMRGNYEAAERFMSRALELRRGFVESGLHGARRSLGLSYNNLGLVYQDSGRFVEAKQALHDALVLRRSIGDVAGVAQTLNNLGTIHQDDGDHVGAGELFEEALSNARQVGDRMREAVILTNLGENHYRRGAPAKAIAELQKAEEVSGGLGDRILEGEILRGLAKAHMLIHDHSKAREYVSSSILLFEQARAKSFLATALRTRGEIAVSAGWGGEEHEKARAAFGKSIQIFEDLGNEIELASSLEAYAGLLVLDKSAASVEEAHTIQKRAEAIRGRLRASDSMEIQLDDESEDVSLSAADE